MQNHGGAIVLMASAAARMGLANHEAISAAKAGVIGLTQSAAASYAARGVRVTCAGYEAEVGPALGKRTSRVLIERRAGTTPCRAPIDRPATVFEWAVLGWAPQGLVCASGDLLRVVLIQLSGA